MFHENAEFWGNLSEPVFAIARRSIAIDTVQAMSQGGDREKWPLRFFQKLHSVGT